MPSRAAPRASLCHVCDRSNEKRIAIMSIKCCTRKLTIVLAIAWSATALCACAGSPESSATSPATPTAPPPANASAEHPTAQPRPPNQPEPAPPQQPPAAREEQATPSQPQPQPPAQQQQPAPQAAGKPGQAQQPQQPQGPTVDEAALAERFAGFAQSVLSNPEKPITETGWKESAALLEAAARLNPQEPRFFRLLAEADLQNRDQDAALTALTSYTALLAKHNDVDEGA